MKAIVDEIIAVLAAARLGSSYWSKRRDRASAFGLDPTLAQVALGQGRTATASSSAAALSRSFRAPIEAMPRAGAKIAIVTDETVAPSYHLAAAKWLAERRRRA